MKFKKFQEKVLESVLEQSEMSDIDRKKILMSFTNSYSEAKFQLMKQQASMLYENSQYFNFFTRLKIAKIILLGG